MEFVAVKSYEDRISALEAELSEKNALLKSLGQNVQPGLANRTNTVTTLKGLEGVNHKRSAKHAKNVADYEAEIKRLLPQAWAMAKDKVGKIYFRNHELKTTTWDAPDVIPEYLKHYISANQRGEDDVSFVDRVSAKVSDQANAISNIVQTKVLRSDTEIQRRVNAEVNIALDEMENEKKKQDEKTQIEKDLARVPPDFIADEMSGAWYDLNEQQKQALANYLSIVGELFKLAMACLLTVFVPQNCKGGPENEYYDGFYTEDFECRLADNLYTPLLTSYLVFALVWNFITLLFALVHYVIMTYREKFMIFHFDYDPDMAEIAFAGVLKKYPDVAEKLMLWNNLLLASSIINIVFLIVNFIVSAVVVFDPSYTAGTKTATVFLTNTLLIVMVFKISLQNAYYGVYEERAYSCVDMNPLSYNAIDAIWLYKRVHPEITQKSANAVV